MNGLAEVEIDGNKYGIKFGLPAMQMIQDKMTAVSFLKSETYNIVTLVQIVYSGYVNYCLIKEIVPTLTFEQVFEWVEDGESNEQVRAVVSAFESSKYIKKSADAPEEKKSPSTGKKLKQQRLAK